MHVLLFYTNCIQFILRITTWLLSLGLQSILWWKISALEVLLWWYVNYPIQTGFDENPCVPTAHISFLLQEKCHQLSLACMTLMHGTFSMNFYCFHKKSRSSCNKMTSTIEREICKTLCTIKNSFHFAVNSFTALERNHDEIVGTIKPGGEESKSWDHIVRIIVLLKRW